MCIRDSIYTYLQNIRQEYVIMGWGDMVVNLPVAEVFQQHLDSGADITILCTQELKGAPRNTVYITQGPDGLVSDLSINPAHAANALESLETYIISKKLLLDMVDYCAAHNIHNFSRGVLLPRLSTLKVLPYLCLLSLIHIWGEDMYAAIGAVQVPGLARADVAVQLQRTVLGQNANCVDAGVDTVGQGKVDDAVLALSLIHISPRE